MRAMYQKVERWLQPGMLLLAALFCLLRFANLRADFPNYSPWMIDQAKFTDEGWWASGAVRHVLLGHWQVAGDYNPAIVVPVWPLLLGVVFHFKGVSLEAVRAVSVAFSIGSVGLVYLLVKRYADASSACLAALLLAASPFAAAFSRLATLDTVTVFEWTLLLWVASSIKLGNVWRPVALGILTVILLLTKTTAAALLPAVLWLMWVAAAKQYRRFLIEVGAAAVLAAASLGCYLAVVFHSRYADDYRYFFDINSLPDVTWSHTFSYSLLLLRHGLWIDRVLYPAAMAALIVSIVCSRQLWRNALFVAAVLAFAGDAVYILRRQDDYAPRYFLAMLVPVILIVVLTLAELRLQHRRMALLGSAVLLIALAIDVSRSVHSFVHRQYQFYDAAQSIRMIVDRDAGAHRLLLGASGDQLALMAGIPSVNDGYSNEDLDTKVAREQPGWYVSWNDLDQDILASLTAFRLVKVATFPVFDNDQRNLLNLYRMIPTKPGSSPR